MKKLLLNAILTFASIAAAAQTPVKDMTEAEVRKVDKDAKKLTLKHGPIKNLDMADENMTMILPCPGSRQQGSVRSRARDGGAPSPRLDKASR